MNVQVEKQENNIAVLTVEVETEVFEKAVEKVYRETRNRINVPGFRKGKAPRKVIEKMYGKDVFWGDAVNDVVEDSYSEAVEKSGEDVVSMPEIEIVSFGDGEPAVYKAKVALKPPVGLGKYKGIKVEPIDDSVSDAEIDEEIEKQRNMNARMIDVTDRPARDGDTVIFDFEGFVDGTPFDGGKADNYSLTLGSGQFIPGFEEKLVGAEIDKPLDVEVTFPEDYHEESLKGKPAVFKCVIHGIREKELPEVNDDFAADVSEFETLKEYREDISRKLAEHKKKEGENARQEQILDEIIADSEIELPEMMIDTNVNMSLRRTEMSLRYQGLTLEQYLAYSGQTVDSVKEQMRPGVIKQLKGSLVLEEIAKKEGLALTDEEFDEEIAKRAEERRMDKEEFRKSLGESGEKELRDNGAVEKALKFIVEQAKETKSKKKEA